MQIYDIFHHTYEVRVKPDPFYPRREITYPHFKLLKTLPADGPQDAIDQAKALGFKAPIVSPRVR